MLKYLINIYFEFLGALNRTMGRWFINIQVVIFSFLILDTLRSALPQILSDQLDIAYFKDGFILLLIRWFWISVIFSAFWLIIRAPGLNLDLWFYYFVIVRLLATTRLGNWYCQQFYGEKAERLLSRYKDIWASTLLHAEGYESPQGKIVWAFPSFIKREHLDRVSFWPHWVFSIVALFNEKSLSINVEERNGKKIWTLAVDLRDEHFGIYSNRGKRFLASRFSPAIENYRELSAQTQKRFMPDAELGCAPVIQGTTIPMRWASGGFLPVIYYEKKYWVSLFFRDISPIGLNVANGATENKDEYKSLNRLIGREFAEEMILLPSQPTPGTEMTQVMFEAVLPTTTGSTHHEFRAAEFVKAHADLRSLHDNFKIFTLDEEDDQSRQRQIHPLDTPFKVTVKYHLPDLRREKQERVEFIVPSINPRETGIETIWLCTFEMKKGEYLIDGEYDLARNYLIRQPVILLEMDYLKKIYQKNNSLGELVLNEKGFDDDKRLPPIPAEHFHLFDADVAFRKRRVVHLEKILADKDVDYLLRLEYKMSTEKSRDAVAKELNRIKSWLNDYEAAFSEARIDGILNHPHLRSLCPVTWKTLELIFAHKINYRKNK